MSVDLLEIVAHEDSFDCRNRRIGDRAAAL
jgi:hypothetical protein